MAARQTERMFSAGGERELLPITGNPRAPANRTDVLQLRSDLKAPWASTGTGQRSLVACESVSETMPRQTCASQPAPSFPFSVLQTTLSVLHSIPFATLVSPSGFGKRAVVGVRLTCDLV